MNGKKVEIHSQEDLSYIGDQFLLLPSPIVILLSKVSHTYINTELTHLALLVSGNVNRVHFAGNKMTGTHLTSHRKQGLYT